MSLFEKLFGKNKTEHVPTTEEAIQRLLEIEDLLKKRSDLLEQKIDEELANAKLHGTKNKRLAIKALKNKKRYEKQLTQLDGTLTTLEYQRENLENANSNAEVLKTMGFAAKAFKTVHADLDIDKVNDLKDEMAEQQELANEINEALSTPFNNDIDEDELTRELEELEQEGLENELLNIPTTELPTVPSDEPKSKQKAKKDESELNELMNWAS